jgi:hypothetical protein
LLLLCERKISFETMKNIQTGLRPAPYAFAGGASVLAALRTLIEIHGAAIHQPQHFVPQDQVSRDYDLAPR